MNFALSDPTSPHGVRLTVRDFLLLADNGAFDAYSKSELIDGEIVCVNAQYARHAEAKFKLAQAIDRAIEPANLSWRLLVEAAVELSEHDIPEPDILLTTYRGEGLVPGDSVVLAIEVSDTTLQHDLGRKAALYAGAGIAECWVLDVTGRMLHQLWAPGPQGYPERREAALGGMIEAVTLADLQVDTSKI